MSASRSDLMTKNFEVGINTVIKISLAVQCKGASALALQSGLIASAIRTQSGLNPDSPIHLPSRIQSGFRWIQLDLVGVWPQLSA